MAELIPTASDAEWHAARRQGITASEIAVVTGLSPWDSPYALYHRKLGILPQEDDSPMMERGRVLEPYIRDKFAAAHPEFMVMGFGRELYRNGGRPWQLATPDGLLYATVDDFFDFEEPVAVAEFKTASSMDEWGEPGTDEIPVYYRAQVLWQMDVMGVRRWHVAVLDVPKWEIREYAGGHAGTPTPGWCIGECPSCDDIALMRDAAQKFLRQVHNEEPPDVDWRPATLGALKQLHPSLEGGSVVVPATLAKRYRAACKAVKAAEQRKALAENQLRQRLGSAQAAYDGATGRPLATRQVYDVAAKTIERKAFTVDKLVPAKPEKES